MWSLKQLTTILCSMKQIIKYYADKNRNGAEEEINFKDRETNFTYQIA